ncbi:MAG: hypothetical protein ACFCA4_12460 [Cyanophyceae cyanobacterium]
MAQDFSSPLPPPEVVADQYRAIGWIAQCQQPAVLVINNAVVMCSPAYQEMTQMSAVDWILDWQCIEGRPIHGNAVRHLKGGAEKLQAEIEQSPSKQLLNHEWLAVYAPDDSVRKFRGSFQYVKWGDRVGRLLVLDGVPQPVELEASGGARQSV